VGLCLAYLCVPLKAGDEIMGVPGIELAAAGHEGSEHDLKLLGLIGGVVAQAVRIRQSAQQRLAALHREDERLQDQIQKQFKPGNMIGGSAAMCTGQRGHAHRVPPHRAGGGQPDDRVHPRRERGGQGTGGERRPREQSARKARVPEGLRACLRAASTRARPSRVRVGPIGRPRQAPIPRHPDRHPPCAQVRSSLARGRPRGRGRLKSLARPAAATKVPAL
jgi:hypothetical protein